jgi:hypothetical protein
MQLIPTTWIPSAGTAAVHHLPYTQLWPIRDLLMQLQGFDAERLKKEDLLTGL